LVVVFAGLVALGMFATPIYITSSDNTTLEIPNPLGVLTVEQSGPVLGVLLLSLSTALLVSLASLILRFVRARGVERQQLKWFLYTSALFVAVFVLTVVVNNELTGMLINMVSLALPLSVGIAILRYHLFDIDLIIRRTVTYAIVVTLLVIVYFASVIVLQQLFANISGQRSEIITVLSTLAIAALFVPLRNSIQTEIDRRFYRNKYDAQTVLAEFARTVRDETDLEQLSARLIQVVDETMQPKSLSVWLKTTAAGRNGARRQRRSET
jgi:hypothetical protein